MMLPIHAVTNWVSENVAFTVAIIGCGNFPPKTGKMAYHTVSHRNNAFVTLPINIPSSIYFFRNIQTDNTMNSFPNIMTSAIKGIAFMIGVAPIKYATIGVTRAMNVPEKIPQYNVAIIRMQFTTEPVRYTDNPFKD